MKINDLTPYPQPATAPATGPAGNVFTDPTFGTPVLRVTDESTNAGEMFANPYSAIYDTSNLDSSAITFVGLHGSNWLAVVDVVNKRVRGIRPLSKAITYWSRVSPNVGYFADGWNAAKLWKYDVSADAWSLVVDLAPMLPAQPQNTVWLGSRGMSWDDNRFHVTAGGQGAAPLNYIYDVKLGRLIGPFTLAAALASGWKPNPPDAAYLFGKSTMDSRGTILFTADTQLVYNVESGATFLPGFGVPTNQYGDVHNDTGLKNVMVGCGGVANPGPNDGFYPFTCTLDPANLSSYLHPRRILGPRFLWGLDSHTSFRDKLGQYAAFVLDGKPIGADVGKVPIFGPEIFELSLNSPGDGSINTRIAHHYSDPSSFTDAGTIFWASPHASQAPDRRMLVCNSTYANKRIDVFIYFLDPAATVPIPDGQLAGVNFSHDEALAMKSQAQWILSQKKG